MKMPLERSPITSERSHFFFLPPMSATERKSKRRLNLATCPVAANATFCPSRRAVSRSADWKYLPALCCTLLQMGKVPPFVPTTVMR